MTEIAAGLGGTAKCLNMYYRTESSAIECQTMAAEGQILTSQQKKFVSVTETEGICREKTG
jgi:hypothetical protein